MRIIKIFMAVFLIVLAYACTHSNRTKNESTTHDLSITISKKYLNLPVSQEVDQAKMSFVVDGKPEMDFVIRLAQSKPDYWVFYDVTPFKDKVLKISYAGKQGGLDKIYQDDVINGQDSLYKESNRPQIHFSSKRGCN
ncbi:MAG: DUF4980 domain-containing protein [Bacteroidota bacterium]